MTVTINFWILFAVALLCSAVGFIKYVYFISIGYGAAIAGQGAAMLFLYRDRMNLPMALLCGLLIIYGCRLSGYLAIRELRSSSYRRHMNTEIKSGDGMKLFVKCMLWVFCALLYLLMVTPIHYRLENGCLSVGPTYILGLILMIGGIVLESAADISKNRQKKQNPRRFCDKGLFAFVRCPNYLGEMIIWTGVLVSGLTSLKAPGQWICAILGYVGIIFVMFSGARRLEVRQNKNYGSDPEYQRYVKTVPIMVPFVPLYSVEKYTFLVL